MKHGVPWGEGVRNPMIRFGVWLVEGRCKESKTSSGSDAVRRGGDSLVVYLNKIHQQRVETITRVKL